MQKVFISNPAPVAPHFSEDDISESKFYGFEKSGSQNKGFITRSGFGKGHFVQKGFDTINNGHGWIYEASNLEKAIGYLHRGGDTVYQFDTYQELLLWGAE